MPKKYVDDLAKIYNEDMVFPTKPGPGAAELEQHGKEGSTGKLFDDGGPANADGFHAPELDPKKKKKDDESSYEEEKYSNAVKEESVQVEAAPAKRTRRGKPLGKKIAKGATKATGAAVGGASGVHSGRAVGKVLGKLAGSSKAGEIAGGVLGGAAGALAGKKAADYVTDSVEPQKNSENLQENDQEEINNFTMSDKSTFDKLFEDVMGEADFELPSEDIHDGDMGLDMDPGADEGDDKGDLKEKLAACIDTLQEVLDTMGDDLGDADEGDDIEDLEDANDPYGEAVEAEEKGHALVNGDAEAHNKDKTVKGAAEPTGGSADGKITSGDGEAKPAADSVAHQMKAKTTGNHKVGAKL
mgnify:CR=1 FL=1